MTDEQSIDGGLTALAGYLYQTVGVLGMQAKAYRFENLTGSNDLEALLMLIQQGELLYEYLDQDAAITRCSLGIDPQTEILLVQFKFSRQIPPAKIGEQELSTILTRLLESARRAKNLGQQIIGYALISNRELGPT